MLRTLSLLLLLATFGYSQWRDSSRVLVPAPSGKAVKVTQFAIGDTNSWKVSGALAYIGGNFYIANGTYYVLMAGSGTSSADTATFVTKGTTQVVSAPKYYTARQYMTSLTVDTISGKTRFVRVDSMLVANHAITAYRSNSTFDTSYAPVTSITHNAPIVNKASLLLDDYSSFIGISEDARLALISKDEGGHGSTIELIEVDSTTGGLNNKWAIGRYTTGAENAELSFTFGKNKDYTINTSKAFLDTSGNFYLNRNSSVSGTQVGFYIPRGIQRAAFDTSGRVTFSNETASGDWVLGLDTYSAAQGSVLLGRRARGNQSAPSQTLSGDILLFLSGRGYTNSSAFGVNNVGVIRIMANENVTSSAQGTFIDFATTQNGTTSRAVDLILDKVNSGTRATFGSAAGTGTGNVYLDSLYFGTTLAIDANRKHTNVGGIATTGAFGVSPQVDTVTYTSMSSGMSKNLTSTAGMYRLSYTLATTTAGSGGTVVMTLSYNNGAAQTTTRSILCNTTSLASGGVDDGMIVFYVASGTPTISTTYTGTGGAVYRIDGVVERLK